MDLRRLTAASSRFPRFSQQLSRSGLLVSRAFRGGDERGDAWLSRTEIRASNSSITRERMFFNRYIRSCLLVVPFDFLFFFSFPFLFSLFFFFLFRPFVPRERPPATRTNDDISDATAFVSKLIAPRQERTLAYCNFLLQRKSETKDFVILGARALALDREKGTKIRIRRQLAACVIFADRIDPPL